MPRLRGFLLALGLAGLGCAVDLITKDWAFRHLGNPLKGDPYRVQWLWPEYVGFETSVNTGALFGLGQGQVHVLAFVSVIALGAIGAWLLWGDATKDRILSIALGLILGGILGNLHDRLGLWGMRGVRDWIALRYGDFRWPNFNVADSLLVCGACLIAWHVWRNPAPCTTGSTVDTPARSTGS